MAVAVRLGLVLAAAGTGWADGPQFSTFLGGKDSEFAAGVAADPQGNIYVAGQTSSADLPVTAGAAQSHYAGGSDAFVAKYAPSGALLWVTYYGGSGGDGARGVAVDANGNVFIAGITSSMDLPVLNALSNKIDGGRLHYGLDAFVAKFDTNGKMVYATYLGGSCNDFAWGVAADARGDAYITGETCSADFPAPAGAGFNIPAFSQGAFVTKLDPQGALVYSKYVERTSPRGIAVDAAGAAYITGAGSPAGAAQLGVQARVMVAKVTPDGSSVAYASTFGGTLGDWGLGIAVDGNGSAYITGVTVSADFPLVHSLQASFGARTLWKSVDDGATWAAVEDSPLGWLTVVVADPKTPGTLYAAAVDGGVFKSMDGGATWANAGKGLSPQSVQALAIDPNNPRTLFATTGTGYADTAPGGFYKSSDGAASWQRIDSQTPSQILMDTSAPGTVYTYDGRIHRSVDGGATWSMLTDPGSVTGLALDPNAPGTLYAPFYFYGSGAGSRTGMYRSTDGGATWSTVKGVGYAPAVLVDASHKPSIIYAGVSARSDDGGVTWSAMHPPDGTFLTLLALDPVSGNPIASAYDPETTLFVSSDRGLTWQHGAGSPVAGPRGTVPGIQALVSDPIAPGTLYAMVNQTQTSAFVTKLSPDGSQILFSTYLHGHPSMDPGQNSEAGGIMPPASPTGSNYATGIALDARGNIAIAGGTRSTDFFVVNPWQGWNNGQYDVFAALISADTNWLYYSSYLGGGLNDQARGIAVDGEGNLILAGETNSGDFPNVNAAQTSKGLGGDAFVMKIAPQLPPGVPASIR